MLHSETSFTDLETRIKKAFIQNIEKVRGNKSDKDLSDIMLCSKGTVSKALDLSSAYATYLPGVSYLVRLCEELNISLDWLLGVKSKASKDTRNITETCRILINLYENKKCSLAPIKVTEDRYIFNPNTGEVNIVQAEGNYNAFYFQEWDALQEEEINLFAEQYGNNNLANKKINLFMKKFLRIHKLWKDGILNEEEYKILLERHLNDAEK